MFEPGASVEVTWVETTNHRSYYRVAFDVDGDDDFPSFLGNGVGTEGIDPRALCPVDGQVILAYDMEDRSGGSHTLSVRLPDVECERCTLQVIQFMYDTGRPYYYQCADLALRRSPRRDLAPDAGGVPDAGSATSASDASAAASDGDGASGPAPRDPRAAPGCWSRIAPDTRRGNPRDDDDDDAPPPAAAAPPSASGPGGGGGSSAPMQPRSDGGCSIRSPIAGASGARAGSDSSAHAWLSALGVWALSRGRRRRG